MSISFELEELRALRNILEDHVQDNYGDVSKIVHEVNARVLDTLEVFERWQPKEDRDDG